MTKPEELGMEREETPTSDIEVTLERLVDLLDGSGVKLTSSQYELLEQYLPDDRDVDLDKEELSKRVSQLICKNSDEGDFGNTLTDVFIDAMQSSPEGLTRLQLDDITALLSAPDGVIVLSNVDYDLAKNAIFDHIDRSREYNKTPNLSGQMIADLVKDILVRLNTGFSMEQLVMLCGHYDGHETVEPMVMNGRTRGHIIDDEGEVKITIPFTMPKRLNDLSDNIMEIADKLATLGYTVDERAWDHLLVYAPQHSQLKKRLKKIEKAVGLTKLRKQIKRVVS